MYHIREKLLREGDMFSTLTVMIGSWMCPYVETHPIVYLLDVNYTSIKLLKKQQLKLPVVIFSMFMTPT